MAALDQCLHLDNLHRAWRWVKSNPEAQYKNYFRAHYANFALAEDELLSGLADRLK